MYIDSNKGKPGDRSQISNETKVDIDKGSLTFAYYLNGDPFQILNVFIGAGEKGQLVWSEHGNGQNDWHVVCLTISEPIR